MFLDVLPRLRPVVKLQLLEGRVGQDDLKLCPGDVLDSVGRRQLETILLDE